jgi:hypothetical protein
MDDLLPFYTTLPPGTHVYVTSPRSVISIFAVGLPNDFETGSWRRS